MIIDTHCHLNDMKLVYFVPDIVSTQKEDNMLAYICIGTDLKTSYLAKEEAKIFEPIYATIGYHPDYCREYNQEVEYKLKEYAKDEKVVAYGEIGLDYHGDFAPKEIQKMVFERQIHVANELDLPLVIHIRDAFEDAINILKANRDKINNGAVIHCFSGSVEIAKIFTDMGFYVSFNGVLTFKNAKKSVEVVKTLPIDKILVETDSPYLSPEPYRGKLNEPKNVNIVVDKMAEILEIDRDELEKILNQNARNLFKKLKV